MLPLAPPTFTYPIHKFPVSHETLCEMCLSVCLSVCLSRGLILQDLTFVHLGNPDQVMTSQGSKVNFSKRWQQFNILDTVRSFQQMLVYFTFHRLYYICI